MNDTINPTPQDVAANMPVGYKQPYNLAHNIRYYRGDFVANTKAPLNDYYHSGPNRIAVYGQDWAGLHTSNTWQQFAYPPSSGRKLINPNAQGTMPTLALRLWMIDQRARTPIGFNQYALDPKALMYGNFRAVDNQGG
jgi:hypothetical protein